MFLDKPGKGLITIFEMNTRKYDNRFNIIPGFI